jgi:phosphatidylglycerophosphate synthase
MYRPNVTLKHIIDAHSWKCDYERYLPISRFVFRPAGFVAAWVAIRIGLSSEAVSWLSAVTGLLGCAALASGKTELISVGIVLLLFFNLLDCVDGSVARVMKTENPYGRFLDSFCGGAVDFIFWGVIGLMAFQHPFLLLWPDAFGNGALFWLLLGLATSYLYIYLGYMERTFDELLRPHWERMEASEDEKAAHSGAQEKEINSGKYSSRWIMLLNNNLRVRETHYVLLLFAFFFRVIDLLLLSYFLYYLALDIALGIAYSRRGRMIKKNYSLIGRD